MRTPLCDMFGIEYPIFAFTHCRDVVAAVSKAGGFGVLGLPVQRFQVLVRRLLVAPGFLDGREGFLLAVANAEGTYYRYMKAWLKGRNR